MDLTTRYLGLALPHPFVCGASPLSADLDMVRRLEDAGAAAIVMHSLFEEQIVKQATRRAHLAHPRSQTRAIFESGPPLSAYPLPPPEYLEHLLRLKQHVRIPVIASLNGTTPEGWLQYARALERAGADALELNFYHIATDLFEDGQTVEQRLIDIAAVVKESIKIPLAVKLSPFYTSLPHVAHRLDRLGAAGLVLFNRFLQPEIDPETRAPGVRMQLSDSANLPLRLRWIAILARRLTLSLAISGGVHQPLDAVKAIMAGADAVQLVSTLLRHGPQRLAWLRQEVVHWCEAHRCETLAELRGVASVAARGDPARFERAAYVSVLQSWKPDG
jgi:dihydroorotate dehydrogenase (fumarate)